MSKLKSIHQYNDSPAKRGTKENGWDGTKGPWCMNILTHEEVHVHLHNTGYNKGGNQIDDAKDWNNLRYNTGFMLEFIY